MTRLESAISQLDSLLETLDDDPSFQEKRDQVDQARERLDSVARGQRQR
jgi:hypothetical protein